MTLGFSLTRYLVPERIKLPLEAREKGDVIRELAELVVGGEARPDRAGDVAEAVLEREAVLSTGIGGGVALPHGRSGAVSELYMAAGTVPDGVDFDALDGRPVRLVFLLVGPVESAGEHVKALSRLSRILGQADLRRRLVECGDAEEFLESLRQAESG